MTAAGTAVLTRDLVWRALGAVHDPELDQPITDLGFVTEASIHETAAGHEVLVRLRLPTYFCAPNFAYLMATEAYTALRALPGVTVADVRLEDHFAAEEINASVAARSGFQGAFPGETDGELADLKRTFLGKGYLAIQAILGKRLVESGSTDVQLARTRVGDLPDKLAEPLVRRKEALGLRADGAAPAFTDERGRAVEAGEMDRHLRRGRTTAVGIDVNTQICKGLLATRYDRTPETTRVGDAA